MRTTWKELQETGQGGSQTWLEMATVTLGDKQQKEKGIKKYHYGICNAVADVCWHFC